MLAVCLRLWCLVLVAVLMSVSSLHLPSPPFASRSAHLMLGTQSSTGERRGVVRRSQRPFASFYRMMQRHSRYLDEQAFLERMFRLFDVNADNLIERDEFRAIMQLLGIISRTN